METKLYNLQEAAVVLGVCKQTLRNWDQSGKLKAIRTPSGYRKYTKEQIDSIINPK